MNHKELKEFTAKKWADIKGLEQEYKRKVDNINQLESELSDISFNVQHKLSLIEKAHTKYNKAL